MSNKGEDMDYKDQLDLFEKIAEYLSLASSLEVSSPKSDYRRANQLSWELGMVLPATLYTQMVKAIADPSSGVNITTVVINARHWFTGRGDGLTSDDIASHAPGIGKQTKG
jgi:hypothetical protein